jgi:high-affinity iron transporter
MVLMAFLAVIREGFETVVFLLAAFNESGSGPSAAIGASTGIAVAAALGWGIYRGGVRLNLSRFFRATGLVLVFVAAGLVVNALHTAHEAGWLNAGQAGTVDLSWLVRPGSVQSSLLTGMLGIQAHPVTAEVIGWLLYLIPVGCYVAWPPGRRVPLRALAGLTGALAALCALGATLLAVLAPGRPARDSRVVALDGGTATVRVDATTYHLTGAGSAVRAAIPVEVYRGQLAAEQTRRALTVAEVVAANGGRLPIGVRPGADGTVASTSTSRSTVTAWIEPRSGYLVAARIDDTVTTTLANATVLPARHTARMLASDDAAARAALDRIEQRDGVSTGSDWLRGVAVACAVAALAALAGERWLRRERAALAAGPARELVRS